MTSLINSSVSDNTADGFVNALSNCAAHLEEAADKIRIGRWNLAEESINRANADWESAKRWLQLSNQMGLRIEALVREIIALRSGTVVTYPEGHDPVNAEWDLRYGKL